MAHLPHSISRKSRFSLLRHCHWRHISLARSRWIAAELERHIKPTGQQSSSEAEPSCVPTSFFPSLLLRQPPCFRPCRAPLCPPPAQLASPPPRPGVAADYPEPSAFPDRRHYHGASTPAFGCGWLLTLLGSRPNPQQVE